MPAVRRVAEPHGVWPQVYVFPKLHESMDPEELKKMQEEMAGGASLGSILATTIKEGPPPAKGTAKSKST